MKVLLTCHKLSGIIASEKDFLTAPMILLFRGEIDIFITFTFWKKNNVFFCKSTK